MTTETTPQRRMKVGVAGLGAGALLAQLGLQRTRFEVTPQGGKTFANFPRKLIVQR